MVKPELGSKRTCVSCSARFYDLTRVPAVCPKCQTEQPIETPRARRSSAGERSARKAVVVPVEVADLPGPEAEAAETATEDEVIEDAADLEGDEADLGGDIEVDEAAEDEDR